MKIVAAQEMARIEKMAYLEGASEEEFMESAGEGVAIAAKNLITQYHLKPRVILLCGSGNNGGDAYVAGRLLLADGFFVQAFSLALPEKRSFLCKLQCQRFIEAGGTIIFVENPNTIHWGERGIIIDGILGTGFHGEVTGLYKSAIEKANASSLPILSIDIPSGLDGTKGTIGSVAIHATETLCLGLPKSGCFLPNVWNEVGKILIHNFGLREKQIECAESDFYLIDDEWIDRHFPSIVRTRHKYQAGYVIGLGGSPGMPGAPLMASFASLRSGAGIVRLFHPRGMEAEFAAAHPEIIRQSYTDQDGEGILNAMNRAAAVFIGPGMENCSFTVNVLQTILLRLQKPCVIDAGALKILSKNPIDPPQGSILTPHHGEMIALLSVPKEISFLELLSLSQDYVEKKKITLVLKGAPTFILHPGIKPYVCHRGDPGMATAGSGDVLTGIIAGLLAQVQDPLRAALLGVQIHGIAGEFAAETWTSYCMTATDITAALPRAFKYYISETNRQNG